MVKATTPTVHANKKGQIKCPYCQKTHKHGAGGGDGHRLSHCDYGSRGNGYNVIFQK